MAQRAIREYDGKAIFAKHWNKYFDGFHYDFKSVLMRLINRLLELKVFFSFFFLIFSFFIFIVFSSFLNKYKSFFHC
jgi:hypothetical protein